MRFDLGHIELAQVRPLHQIAFGEKYIFEAIFRFLFSLDFKVFFEENSEMGLFLLSAIYLHVSKD